MPYDWSTIESVWLGESKVSLSPLQLVQGFNAAEEHLGTDWVERHRATDGVIHTGALATLPVAAMGIRLLAVDKTVGFADLVVRLRAGDRAARTELSGAYLCIRGLSSVRLEFGVPAAVGNRMKRPDFRVTSDGAVWTNVELTAPNRSEPTARGEKLIQAIAEQLLSLPDGASIEVLLLRDSDGKEIEELVQRTITLATTMQNLTEEFRDVAIVTVNRLPPCVVEPQDYGMELGPIIGVAKGVVENGVPKKSVSVRVPVIDQRAENFLTTEARQLPKNEPGLVIMDMTSVPGGFREWEPLLRRRLQPSLHTRVSGIFLVRWGTHSTPEGEAIVPEVQLIENSHATMPLPEWLRKQVSSSSGVAIGK